MLCDEDSLLSDHFYDRLDAVTLPRAPDAVDAAQISLKNASPQFQGIAQWHPCRNPDAVQCNIQRIACSRRAAHIKSPPWQDALGSAAEAAGDADAARLAYERAIALDPEFAVPMLKLGPPQIGAQSDERRADIQNQLHADKQTDSQLVG